MQDLGFDPQHQGGGRERDRGGGEKEKGLADNFSVGKTKLSIFFPQLSDINLIMLFEILLVIL